MTFRVADNRELVGWILSFGRGVKVVRPAELKGRAREEALALSRHRGVAMTVRPNRRKSSSNAKQGMRSSNVVTTTNEMASQNERW